MAYNYSIKVENISNVTLELFKQGYFLAYKGGITSLAPLGFSGDSVILFGECGNGTRKSVVSLRNYGNDCELLITDINGGFIFYGRYHASMGAEFITNKYWDIFNDSKEYIESDLPLRPDFANCEIPEDVNQTIGWDMIKLYSHRKNIL